MITYAGNMYGTGVGPMTRRYQICETCYVGQLVMDAGGDTGSGHCQILDVPAQDTEDDHRILGVVAAVHNINDTTIVGSGLMETATYDTTQAAIVANNPIDASWVEVIPALPGILFKAPIYNGTYGTAITELKVSSASTDGLVVTHAADTAIASPDKFTTVYCRKGANRGLSRTVTTVATGSQTVLVAFPYDTVVGDVFVTVNLKLGISRVYFDATAAFIDASAVVSANYYDIVVHDLYLDEKGKEAAVFTFPTSCTVFGGAVGVLGF